MLSFKGLYILSRIILEGIIGVLFFKYNSVQGLGENILV